MSTYYFPEEEEENAMGGNKESIAKQNKNSSITVKKTENNKMDGTKNWKSNWNSKIAKLQKKKTPIRYYEAFFLFWRKISILKMKN